MQFHNNFNNFISEGRNNKEEALEIIIRIDNDEGYKILRDFVKDFDQDYYNKFISLPYYSDTPPHYYFICIDKSKARFVPALITSYPFHDLASAIDDLENRLETSSALDGVYNHIFTIQDMSLIKKMLMEQRIIDIPIPRYMMSLKDRKDRFIREDNELNEKYSDDYNTLIITIDSMEFLETYYNFLSKHGMLDNSYADGHRFDNIEGLVEDYLYDGNTPYIRYRFGRKSLLIGKVERMGENVTNNVFDDGGEKFDKVYDTSEWEQVQNMLLGKEKNVPSYMKSAEERKNRFIRESNDGYPYRFKTEEEFIEEFGENWKSDTYRGHLGPAWVDYMDVFFGIDYPYNNNVLDLENKIRPRSVEFTTPDSRGGWHIGWYMLTPNKPKQPSYMLSAKERNKRFIHENIITFDNFIVESNKTKVPFIISQRLEGILSNIKHPIAKRMISESNSLESYSTEATLIDYDEKDTNKFTFTTSSKFTDALKNTLNIEYSTAHIPTLYDIMKVNKELYEELRTSIKIGRLVNKLYPSEYTPNGENSIEDFVNAVKLSRNRKFDNFEIVTGKDIIKYYYRDNYDDEAFNGSELGNSCMGYDWCESFINFYKINPSVSLLILRSETDNNKIVGRALIWDLDTVDGKKVKGKFMDRIYYTKNYQKELFIEHARDNEWYHYLNGAKIWNPNVKDYFKKFIVISTVKTFVENPLDVYPYMDTMMFYFPNSMFLSNSSLYSEETGEDYYYLQNTEGGYSVDNDGEDSDW